MNFRNDEDLEQSLGPFEPSDLPMHMNENPPSFRVLLVDDNPAIHNDFRKILLSAAEHEETSLDEAEKALFNRNGSAVRTARFEIDSAHRGEDALHLLCKARQEGRPYALAFVDVRMPQGWDGVETVERLWRVDPALQAVICTAYADYSWRALADRLGLTDNLVVLKKPVDTVEVLQLAVALTNKWSLMAQAQHRLNTLDDLVEERGQALDEDDEGSSQRSEDRFAAAFQASPIPLAIQPGTEDRFLDVNDAFVHMSGYSRDELLGSTLAQPARIIQPDPGTLLACGGPESAQNISCQITKRSGSTHPAMLSYEGIQIAGKPHILVLLQDVSERQEIEAQIRHTQKMEAIGQLAAGIAHDFNNLLTIIQGHASLQLEMPHADEDLRSSLTHIEQAAERAAELTRQLLAFSRRQIIRPQPLDLHRLFVELEPGLRAVIGNAIVLDCEVPADLPPIHADRAGVEQVVMNLVANARDAMPKGGRLLVSAAPFHAVPEERQRDPEAAPGTYVCLSVADNGCGMDDATRARIFEPFFSTKGVNKGSGMGLATVYGIAKQHHGWADVITSPGKGAVFRVFFPVTDSSAEKDETPASSTATSEGQFTILIVEDDEAVRGLVREVLLHAGYRVLEAEHADAAYGVWKKHRSKISLMLTDMVMPGSANGLDLAQKLLEDRPDLKVIYTSGYSADLFTSNVHLQDGVNYLPKPYLSSKLIRMLENALEPAAT